MISIETPEEHLWKNAQDSLRHAYSHCASQAEFPSSNRWHDEKWMLISIHHAAMCMVNMWLYQFNPTSELLKKTEFPYLVPALKELTKTCAAYFKHAEMKFLSMCKDLNSLRNDFYHRRPPDSLSRIQKSELIILFAGLLRMIEGRRLDQIENVIGDFRVNFASIIEEIQFKPYNLYVQMISNLVCDKHSYFEILDCPICDGHTVLHGECQACFRSITTIDCDVCGQSFEIYTESRENTNCPSCEVRAVLDNN